jgi:hypothetical protein
MRGGTPIGRTITSGPQAPRARIPESPFLIDTPAIRNRLNPLKTKHNIFSNRHSPRPLKLHQNRAHRAASSPSNQETGIPARTDLSGISACMCARECDITAPSAARAAKRNALAARHTTGYSTSNFFGGLHE